MQFNLLTWQYSIFAILFIFSSTCIYVLSVFLGVYFINKCTCLFYVHKFVAMVLVCWFILHKNKECFWIFYFISKSTDIQLCNCKTMVAKIIRIIENKKNKQKWINLQRNTVLCTSEWKSQHNGILPKMTSQNAYLENKNNKIE